MNKLLIKIVILSALISSVSGCASMPSNPICAFITGNPTPYLEDVSPRFTRTFPKDVKYCYDKTIAFIKGGDIGGTVFKQAENDYIVAMNLNREATPDKKSHLGKFTHTNRGFDNCIDTTEVCISFKVVDPQSTKILVYSENSALAKEFARRLFRYIAK